jgi:hypothetical protein
MGGDPIVSRERVAQQAETAAMHSARFGTPWPNPYPPGCDAHAAWRAAYERYLQQHAAPDAEASA